MDSSDHAHATNLDRLPGEATQHRRALLAGIGGVAAGAILTARPAKAGPLDPPSGPVASTGKTLTEVEPRTAVNATNTPGNATALYRITQPGSYYLTGNITGVAGKHGIEIASSGVTLDLCGFELAGVPNMGGFDAISVSSDLLRDIAVLNGSVRNWGDEGVDLGFLSIGCRVDGVRSSGNAGLGINGGISCVINNCTASFNGQTGIRTNNGSTVTGCSAYSNTGSGVQVNHGCTVSTSSVYLNATSGIVVGIGSAVTDCTAYQNTGNGIQLGDTSSAGGCTADNNTGNGIDAANACGLTQCEASFNGADGIRGVAGMLITGCTSRSNTGYGIRCDSSGLIRDCAAVLNGLDGIRLVNGAVSGCFSNTNGAHGITVNANSSVANCTAQFNTQNGIDVGATSLITGNKCAGNGAGAGSGAGIICRGIRSRLEGNNCTNGDRGIEAIAPGNIIIGNTCAGNDVDWVLVAGNSFGPILDRRGQGGGAVNGFSAPTNLNTTDPHANFSI